MAEPYRLKFTDAEKALFRERVRNGVVDPKTHCPFCLRRARLYDNPARYCHEHKSWFIYGRSMRCQSCRVQWGVMTDSRCCDEGALPELALAGDES